MSCCVGKFDWCILKQESFKSIVFDFGDFDISDDIFIYEITKFNPKSKKEINTNINGNKVFISEFDFPIGIYEHQLIWQRNSIKEVVFQGELKITDKGTNCNCDFENSNIIVNIGDEIVNIVATESVVNNLMWSGSVLHFEVNNNMELIMYETIPTSIDFKVENGFLILDFN